MNKILTIILLFVVLVSTAQTQLEEPLDCTDFADNVNVTSIDIYNYYLIWVHELDKSTYTFTKVVNIELSNDELFAINEVVAFEINKNCIYRITITGINTNTWWIDEIDKWLK